MASSVEKLLEDFVGLYTRDGLPRWRGLFLEDFMAAASNDDGSVKTWDLVEFYERQRELFAGGKPVSEVLHNTEIRRVGEHLACVSSDFVWTDGQAKKPGKLAMVVIAERGAPKIQSLAFSYRG